MSGKVRCGIIGCGVIAPSHVESYQRLEDLEVRWACDLVEERASTLAERYGIAHVSTDFRDVLADENIDAVSVCTDHASHAEISVAALEAGKHVLCEKALAATSTGMDRMLAAHRARPDLVFSGVFQHRFDKVFQYVKRLVEDGAFGTLLTASLQMSCLRTREYYQADKWRGTWAEEGGSVMINQAIHYVDLLNWIMGGTEALSAAFANLTHGDAIETEDTAAAVLRFRNRALGTITATSSSHISWEPNLAFYGSAGSLEIRNGTLRRAVFKNTALAESVEADLKACRDAPKAEAGKRYYGPSHPSQIADFVEAIREGRPPFVTAESARETVALVLAIYRSHREGVWVTL